MFEKVLLAVTITFSLTLLAGAPTQSSASSTLIAKSAGASETVAEKSVRSLLMSKLIEPHRP